MPGVTAGRGGGTRRQWAPLGLRGHGWGQAWGRLAPAALDKDSGQAGRANHPCTGDHPRPPSPPEAGDTVPPFPSGCQTHLQALPRAGMNLLPPPWQFSPGIPELSVPALPWGDTFHMLQVERGQLGRPWARLLCPPSLAAPARPRAHPAAPATLQPEGEKPPGQSRIRLWLPASVPSPLGREGIKKSPKRAIPCLLRDSRAASRALFSEPQAPTHARSVGHAAGLLPAPVRREAQAGREALGRGRAAREGELLARWSRAADLSREAPASSR